MKIAHIVKNGMMSEQTLLKVGKMENNYLLVTTFNNEGYNIYGKKMLEAFLKYWPKNQQIIVYTENFNLDKNLISDRIIVKDILSIQSLVDFKDRHKNNPAANGYKKDPNKKDFMFDAVRFSHKIFSLYDAITNNFGKSIVWVDGDTITHSDVPEDFLMVNFPQKDYGIAYLGRIKQYSECGWVVYHTNHPLMKDFWERFIDYYRNDTIFNLQEWHDSFVFDVTRKEFEEKGMLNQNITPGFIAGHPFINCVLGEYMDHMKGPRKKVGRSKKNERIISSKKTIAWWQSE
jgi:hypothetical protein